MRFWAVYITYTLEWGHRRGRDRMVLDL